MKKNLPCNIILLLCFLGFSSHAIAGTDNQEIKVFVESVGTSTCISTGLDTTDVGFFIKWTDASCEISYEYKFGPKNWFLVTAYKDDSDFSNSCQKYFTEGDNRTPDGDGTLNVNVKATYDKDKNKVSYTDCYSSWQAD